MGDHSESNRIQSLFESTLQDYGAKTGVILTEHPFTLQLQNCDSVEATTTFLRQEARASSDFQGWDRIMNAITSTVSILFRLFTTASLGGATISFPFPPTIAILGGLAILLFAAEGVDSCGAALIDFLESIERLLKHLDISTQVPRTPAMDETVVRIMMELLSILALLTKELKQGRSTRFVLLVSERFGGKDVEAVLQRLDRLTWEEARRTATQTLDIIYGLFQNMRVVMGDGKASIDDFRETLETLHQMASDMNRSKREKLQQDIRVWLSPPDSWKNHNIASGSRHPGTADWFVQGHTYSEWKSPGSGPSSLLWIHGKPGAGKSVFCSTIIEDIEAMRKLGVVSLAFFYCDFRERQKKGLRGLLSSVLVQLCFQSNSYCDILSKFYSEHENGHRHPNDEKLARCLRDLVALPGQAPVYLIVDALDECSNTTDMPSPREEILMLIVQLIESQHTNLRICVTSRPETDIKSVLGPLIFRSVSLHDESGQIEDIENYIKSAINLDPRNRRWKAEDKQLVIDELTKRADGMFRWVYCQVVYLRGCHPGRIRHALVELPDTLDETYERTLREINKADSELAHRLFQCVAVASRPLRVEEVAEFLAFDFSAGPMPKFQERWRLGDPLDSVLSTCSTLLSLVDVNDSPIIQFSHFSVREFLMSSRFAERCDTISRRYHISMTPAHTLVTQACLGLIMHLDKNITWDILREFPLAEYAAQFWFYHALFEGVSKNTEEGMKQLFDSSKPHLAVWLWIYDTTQPRMQGQRPDKPLPPQGTPLHYAAFYGLHPLVKYLAAKHPQDVNSRGFREESTPLNLASRNGHVEVVRLLVEHGADAVTQDEHMWTPLHWASAAGSVEVTRFLIEHGADVTAQDEDGLTPLHRASKSGLSKSRSVDVARLLVEHGADASARNKSGSTPLHDAARSGNVEITHFLIEHGADATAQDGYGQTPLSQVSNCEIAHLLVELGADVTADDEGGATPLHKAAYLGNVEVANFLIERGADATAKDETWLTPLHEASESASVEVACLLIKHNADITAQDKSGSTPLHWVSHRLDAEDTLPVFCYFGASTCEDKYGWSVVPLRPKLERRLEVVHLLVDHGADLETRDKDGRTPLHVALLSRNVGIVRFLIELGADATAQDYHGSTPLHIASLNGHLEVAYFLIQQGVDVTAQDVNGMNPLHWAATSGTADIARLLVGHGVDATAQDNFGCTPLLRASSSKNVEVARLLIEQGADAISRNEDGSTPLHWASGSGSVEIARLLIEHHNAVDITAQDRCGRTPLHWGSWSGSVEVARLLIEHGADATFQNEDRVTPLHWASYSGIVELARLLVEHGADAADKDKFGRTPLHWASQSGNVEVAGFLIEHGAEVTAKSNNWLTPLHQASVSGSVKLAYLLVEHGADVTAQDQFGWTPLHDAVSSGSVEVARLLIEHGADATAQDNYGWTPLHEASKLGMVEVTGMLVEHGADVMAQEKDGSTTPLHWAAQLGSLEVASILIDHGAETTAQDKHGRTPLHKASEWGNAGVALFLIELGADTTAKDKDGATSLHHALRWECLEVARLLIENGAGATAQDKDGLTPLHYLASGSQSVETARLLDRHSPDATADDEDGSSSFKLNLMGAEGCVEVARLLVEHGADTAARDKMGRTALHMASQSMRMSGDLGRFLIEHGADPTIQDNNGSTPLHLAVRSGNAEVARLLVDHGADATAQEKGGSTPLHLALQTGNADLASFLMDRGENATLAHETSEAVDVDLARSLIEQDDERSRCLGLARIWAFFFNCTSNV